MSDQQYIYDPIETDADALAQNAFDYLQSRWPSWIPDESNLEAWLIAACARMVAEARDVAADVPPAIFKYFGQSILGVPPVEATYATVASTWTLTENESGKTIEAGTLVGVIGDDGTTVAFEVVDQVFIAAGVLTTAANGVLLRAQSPGAEASGIGGAGDLAEIIDPVAWVDTITLADVTGGGFDEETDEEYLDRLSTRMTLLTPRPILPRDFEILAQDIAAQQGARVRVMVLDNYDPTDSSFDNEKMVTIAMVDLAGADVSVAIKGEVDAQLQAQRELNFIVWVVDPQRTDVDVTAGGKVVPGYDPATVSAAATDAVTSFLQPANWGQPPSIEADRWIYTPTVRHQDISTVLNNVEGLSYWTTLTLGINGGAQTAADQALPGHAPLTEPGNIVINITV